jgi:hypothetical protein
MILLSYLAWHQSVNLTWQDSEPCQIVHDHPPVGARHPRESLGSGVISDQGRPFTPETGSWGCLVLQETNYPPTAE